MSSTEAFKFLANQLSGTPDVSKQFYNEDFDKKVSELFGDSFKKCAERKKETKQALQKETKPEVECDSIFTSDEKLDSDFEKKAFNECCKVVSNPS